MHLGLIGYPLSHSFSQRYFTDKFAREGLPASWHYELYPLQRIEQFTELVAAHPDLHGLNVTIPYKQSILPYLDELSPAAAAIGAVNTLVFQKGRIIGHNTDVIGFGASLDLFLQATQTELPLQAIVLGTGGAAAAVCWALQQRDISFRSISRTPTGQQWSYDQLDAATLRDHLLIVNTTPLGMHPHIDTLTPIPYTALGRKHLLYDLVYNPPETAFLAAGKAQGAATLNGLPMLQGQAEAAWAIWNR